MIVRGYGIDMRRDADATRARLLDAARDEFAEHGIAGGRVDRIAARAGVNKQRIYGHFGSKELLFEAVITEAFDERSEALGPPSGDLGDFVGRVYDFHREHPQLLRLYLWEALHYGRDGRPGDDARVESYTQKAASVAQQVGLDDDNRARTLLLTLIGIGAWPLAVPQLTQLICGDDRNDDDLRDELVELTRRMIKGH